MTSYVAHSAPTGNKKYLYRPTANVVGIEQVHQEGFLQHLAMIPFSLCVKEIRKIFFRATSIPGTDFAYTYIA
jgi:hypothetical protein